MGKSKRKGLKEKFPFWKGQFFSFILILDMPFLQRRWKPVKSLQQYLFWASETSSHSQDRLATNVGRRNKLNLIHIWFHQNNIKARHHLSSKAINATTFKKPASKKLSTSQHSNKYVKCWTCYLTFKMPKVKLFFDRKKLSSLWSLVFSRFLWVLPCLVKE